VKLKASLLAAAIADKRGGARGLGENIKASPADPLIPIKLGNEKMDFLVDSRATLSIITSCKVPLSKIAVTTFGAMGKRTLRPFLQPMECMTGNIVLTPEFLCTPECPLPLLGHDLLCKLNAQLTFSANSVQLHLPPETAWEAQIFLLTEKISEELQESILNMVSDSVILLVWASKKPVKAKV